MIDLGEFQALVAATKLAASDLRVTGNNAVGSLVKAAYRLGSGTIQFTRAPDAGGPAVDVGAVVASGSTYTIQLSDRGYVIGARPITYLPGAAVGVQVPITAPLAPTMGAASSGNGSVSTTFTAPGDNGGSAITGYVVYAYRAADDYQLGLATGAASPINISGLPNGVAMYSKVAAQNVKGTGPQSNASLVVTPSASVSRVFGNRTRSPMASASVGASLEQGNWLYLGYCPFVPYGWKARFPLHWTNAANLESAAPNNITHRGWWIAHSATKDINTTTRVRGTVAGSTNAITYDPTVNSVGFVTDLLATNGDIPAGRHIWIMNAYAVPSGGAVPANYDFGPNSTLEGSVGSAATSQVATLNSGVLPATGANGVGGQWNASTVECYGNDGKVVMVFGGDSVGEGQNETSFTQTDGVFGFISRGMAMGTPMYCANMCIPGSSLGYWVDTGRVAVAKKLDLLQMGTPVGFDSLVSQHSTNGFGSGGTSAANIEAKYRAYIALLKAEFPGKPIHQVGIVCKASATTDGLSTAANQTAAYPAGSGVQQLMDKLRLDHLGGLVQGFIDVAPYLSAPGDSSKWPPNSWTGTIAAGFDYVSGANTIRVTGATPPPDDGGFILDPLGFGATLSGAAAGRSIKKVTDNGDGTWTILMPFGFATDKPAGTAVAVGDTIDMVHPAASGHKKLAVGIDAYKPNI
jgi:hypothetical protein